MAATLTDDQTQALKKQIEFYFSDSNYPRDKFMRITAAENNGRILYKYYSSLMFAMKITYLQVI